MTQKVNAQDIQIGMFIADLDRPWIDTPFLLQGFLVEDEEQLRQLRQHCQWVLIDPHRSVGAAFDKPIKKAVVARRDPGNEPRVTINRVTGPDTPGNAPNATQRSAAPPTPVKPPNSNPRRAAPREFAVSVKDSRSSGNPASGRLAGAAPSRHAGDVHAAKASGDQPAGGLWGKLRSGVAGM
ncbi:MAG: DUF3391 domain-containing protein, partial [Prolixibacteraceae bacterium]|nr:DUF3391 domain-containing protein [Burkholderiales bacterium]